MAKAQRTVDLHVLGDKGSGKSLFIRQLANTVDFRKLKISKKCYVVELDLEKLIGIPVLLNIREYRSWKSHRALIAIKYCRADAYLLFYDIEETTIFERAPRITRWRYLKGGKTYLLGNKSDRVDRDNVQLMDPITTKRQPVKRHLMVSAKDGHNIHKMLVDVLGDVLGSSFVINSSPPYLDVPTRSRDRRLEVQTYPVGVQAGLCVIVNNDTFDNAADRHGADKDVIMIETTFRPLGFDMGQVKNKDISTLLEDMIHISKLDYTSYSMFVCFIMSHGSENTICGVDGLTIEIEELTSLFCAQNCPGLTGKPKLFIIQACQGSKVNPSATDQCDGTGLADTRERTTVPMVGDFLIAYATSKGFIAYRNSKMGSPFIQTLCETIRDFPENHIVDILTVVNEKVAAMKFKGSFKQMPMFQSQLRKHLYLKRPSVRSGHDDIVDQ
ncbi:caspase-3-like [Haliotis rubra]|uniref:caspase-3-like n=1 Tax=Haliotis rubra TaxID=36100 RepID=UPI001EE61850|nr:caspase-3-like [Haliotis rubra]XP_046567251.1 caspase-3-like [Haliotis rubra]